MDSRNHDIRLNLLSSANRPADNKDDDAKLVTVTITNGLYKQIRNEHFSNIVAVDDDTIQPPQYDASGSINSNVPTNHQHEAKEAKYNNYSLNTATPTTPLIQSSKDRAYDEDGDRRRREHDVCCFVSCGLPLGTGLTIGFVFLLLYLDSNNKTPTCQEPDTSINYNFSIPYVPGGKICVNNVNGPKDLTITNFSMISNVKFDGMPWGDLIKVGNVSTELLGLGMRRYIITPNPQAYIPRGSSACLEYNFISNTAANSNLKTTIGMNPLLVSITTDAGNDQILNVQDIQTCVPNPLQNYTLAGWLTQYGIYEGYALPKIIPLYNQINYFSIGFNPQTGALTSLDPYADNQLLPALAIMRMQYPYLKTMMAIGGYCSDPAFSELTANLTTLITFVNEVADAIYTLQMDGVNIDWENCADGVFADPEKFSLLFSALRNRSHFSPFLISAAIPAGAATIAQIPNATWCDVAKNVNQLAVMTYDYNGAWSERSGFLAPLNSSSEESVANTIKIYLDMRCIPLNILQVGIPAYGRAVIVKTTGDTNGYNQSVVGVPAGQFDATSGVFRYRCVSNSSNCDGGNSLPNDLIITPTSENPFGNGTAQQPWGSSNSTKIVVSFDDPTAAGAKADFIVTKGLAGGHVWDIAGDTSSTNCPVVGKANSLSCSAYLRLKDGKHVIPVPATNTTTNTTANTTMTQTTVTNANHSNISALKEFFSQLPTEMSAAFLQAVDQGLVYTFLPLLTEDTVTECLTRNGYSKDQIYYTNLALRSLIMMYMGTLTSSTIGVGTQALFMWLGFSKETSETAATASSITSTAVISSASIPTVAAIMAGGFVGSYVANSIFRAGTRMFSQPDNSVAIPEKTLCV